jgi:hypothetical protein
MSDIPTGHLRYHEIDIPARFIQQAMEHIDHTQVRYVTLIFAGEMTGDAICVGITTRQRPRVVRPDSPQTASETSQTAKKPATRVRSLNSITDAVVLDVVRQRGPVSTADISVALGVPPKAIPQRQKIWRTVTKLNGLNLIMPSTSAGRAKSWSVTEDAATVRMPLRPRRKMNSRQQITEEMVLAQFRAGLTTSKAISDAMDLPRQDASLRGRISEIIRNLLIKGVLDKTDKTVDGGPVYQLVTDPTTGTG